MSHNTRYKRLALDLDGTLLCRNGTVADVDRDAIARVSAHGVPVTIVTGRLYSGSRAVAEAIGVRGPIACINGSQLVDTRDHDDLLHHRMGGSLANRLRHVAARRRLARFGLFADRIVSDPSGERFGDYVRTWSRDMEYVADVLEHAMWDDEHGLSALVAVGDPDDIEQTASDINAEIPEAQVASFAVHWYRATAGLVVRSLGTDKGVALEWLARYHGVTTDEVVAVGDWLNDVPMFRRAGRSFAMDHAPDAVKSEASDLVPRDPDEGGGVAAAIARAFGL